MISVMQPGEIEGGEAGAVAGEAGGAPATAGNSDTAAGGIGHAVIGAAEAVVEKVEELAGDVESGARELIHEAMRKLGAVHVALDAIEHAANSELRQARDKVGSAIISVARHIAG